MSFKVEIDSVDAELLSLLRKSQAASVMNWDNSLTKEVSLKVELKYPLGSAVPQGVTDAINECIAKCVRFYASFAPQ